MRWKPLAATIVAAALLAGCGSATKEGPKPGEAAAGQPAQKVTLTLSTPDPDSSSITEAAKHFAELVAEKSKGAVEIKVFPNGTLYNGDPNAAVKQLGAGSLDMLTLSTSLYANFDSRFTAISIPYLFDSTDQLLKYLNGEPGQELLAGLDRLQIKGLALWTRSFRQMTNSKRPITGPQDLKGLKFRVPNNPLWVEFFKAAGAAPTPMAFGEVYNALQLKTIDGQENPIDIARSAKFYEVQKYLTISNHMADGWVVGININKFASLPQDVQKILMEAAAETQSWKLRYDQEQDAQALEFLKSKGMEVNTLTPEQQQAFVDLAKPLYPKFAELVRDQAFFEKTLKFVGKAN
ncbi:DctP family TRAP transporter solute-binding subunit [Caldinitratiruptor microaerophilus]|uniref:ABC transporter substrate-binding protein n=1 Tax=Caldinitratiruptor microaerophilus TaxID=671077 RepID=A0AA35G881_9FIRM|nr:DctP family TRAP transporter solute-binding subunit [Caldinitratiruptor microaerophilus]BDG60153.1 ABC transporter substrate-binding protein [Caldinitratiruptor microaerophilus]